MSLRLLIHTITQYSITARRCANRMILRSCCFLGTPHRGRARKALRASWGPSTTTVSTHIRTIYAHTHTHKHTWHGGEWIRSEGQTPSHHGSNIPATAVCLTSTSGPKPSLLAQNIAFCPCDTQPHTHTPGEGWGGKVKERQSQK